MSHASVLVAIDPTEDIDEAITEAMAPFDENGEMFADGSRWDWWSIGGRYSGRFLGKDTIQVKDLSPNKLNVYNEQKALEHYATIQKEALTSNSSGFFKLIHGYESTVTIKEIVADYTKNWFPACFAFLHKGKWHEASRLGWFGGEAKTECEIKNNNSEPTYNRCKATSNLSPECYIVSWGDDWETWEFKFYDRFIKPLPPETILVVVDYHV